MDGVNGVSIEDLQISNLHEQSAMGSELCGEYWYGTSEAIQGTDVAFNGYGGGNTRQNSPYFYGYTGNYAHGIFSDFAALIAERSLILLSGSGPPVFTETAISFPKRENILALFLS